jgi:hypothetical protein
MKTIIYLTDNTLDEKIASKCKEILVKEAGGNPIVSVSQKPIDLGINICVGEIGRSWLSLYKQLIIGLKIVKTEDIAIAEHDCLYSHEHFNWIPPKKDIFYYNFNHWLVQWGGNHPELNGMYSYWPKRTAMSQLICNKDLLMKATQEVINLLAMGLKVEKGLHWYGEPGVKSEQFKKAFVEASSGRPTQLQTYLKAYLVKNSSDGFETTIPNLDIRHGTNFTGPKRGNKRRYTLPYWGEFKQYLT